MAITRTKLLLLLAYLATMGAVVASLVTARQSAFAELDTPEAREQWRAWAEETQRKDAGGPIERRAVGGQEPPTLILLRDRFAVIVLSSLLISSFLFAFIAFAAWGAFRSGRQ
jgi:hypothetical protein